MYCIMCGAGKYQSGLGMVSEKSCLPCGAGKYQSGVGMVDERNCTDCEAGSYQSGSGMGLRCVACSSGTYMAGFQISSSSSCISCEPGKYQSGEGMVSSHACLACVPGTYSSGSAMISISDCSLCGQGQYQSAYGATVCERCQAGKYLTGSGMLSDSACVSLAELFHISNDSVVLTIKFFLNMNTVLKLQDRYVGIVVLAVGIDADKTRTIVTQEPLSRRSVSTPAVAIVMSLNISTSNCTAILILEGRGLIYRIDAAGLPLPWQVSTNSNASCPEQSATASDSLSNSLRIHAIAVNSVVATLIGGTVVNQVASQFSAALSFSSPGPSRGASIHQLIDAVQFLNIFGKMFKDGEPSYFNAAIHHARREIHLPLNISSPGLLENELNSTLSSAAVSAAAEFRYK